MQLPSAPLFNLLPPVSGSYPAVDKAGIHATGVQAFVPDKRTGEHPHTNQDMHQQSRFCEMEDRINIDMQNSGIAGIWACTFARLFVVRLHQRLHLTAKSIRVAHRHIISGLAVRLHSQYASWRPTMMRCPEMPQPRGR